MHACMTLVGFDASDKLKSRWLKRRMRRAMNLVSAKHISNKIRSSNFVFIDAEKVACWRSWIHARLLLDEDYYVSGCVLPHVILTSSMEDWMLLVRGAL